MKLSHLTDLYQSFQDRFGYTISSAIELEFYLIADDVTVGLIFKDCCTIFKNLDIKAGVFKKESEEFQYEISVGTYDDPLQTALHVIEVKKIIVDVTATYHAEITFAAKPFDGKAGNGMHVNVSIWDENFKNLFEKGLDEIQETDELQFAIAGLCATMMESMIFFAPNPESYKRFEKNDVNNFFPYSFVPINVSWGGNNRTVALRVPESSSEPHNRHLEHRVAGSDANPLAVVFAVIAGVNYGFQRRKYPNVPKYWGNAYNENNDFVCLPVSIGEALEFYKNGQVIPQLCVDYKNEDLMKTICQI